MVGRYYMSAMMKRRFTVLIVLGIPLLIVFGAGCRSLAHLQIESLTALHAAELAPIVESEAVLTTAWAAASFEAALTTSRYSHMNLRLHQYSS
jgi:hypothetical protein